jgi:hypothetical protein
MRVLWRRILRWVLFCVVWVCCISAGYLTFKKHFRWVGFIHEWNSSTKVYALHADWPLTGLAEKAYAAKAREVGVAQDKLGSATGWYVANVSFMSEPNPGKARYPTEPDSLDSPRLEIISPAALDVEYFLDKQGNLSRRAR